MKFEPLIEPPPHESIAENRLNATGQHSTFETKSLPSERSQSANKKPKTTLKTAFIAPKLVLDLKRALLTRILQIRATPNLSRFSPPSNAGLVHQVVCRPDNESPTSATTEAENDSQSVRALVSSDLSSPSIVRNAIQAEPKCFNLNQPDKVITGRRPIEFGICHRKHRRLKRHIFLSNQLNNFCLSILQSFFEFFKFSFVFSR